MQLPPDRALRAVNMVSDRSSQPQRGLLRGRAASAQQLLWTRSRRGCHDQRHPVRGGISHLASRIDTRFCSPSCDRLAQALDRALPIGAPKASARSWRSDPRSRRLREPSAASRSRLSLPRRARPASVGVSVQEPRPRATHAATRSTRRPVFAWPSRPGARCSLVQTRPVLDRTTARRREASSAATLYARASWRWITLPISFVTAGSPLTRTWPWS